MGLTNANPRPALGPSKIFPLTFEGSDQIEFPIECLSKRREDVPRCNSICSRLWLFEPRKIGPFGNRSKLSTILRPEGDRLTKRTDNPRRRLDTAPAAHFPQARGYFGSTLGGTSSVFASLLVSGFFPAFGCGK